MDDRGGKHVFVSYVREDSDRVDRVCEVLEAAGIPYWRDINRLEPGDAWKKRIRNAIKEGAALTYLARQGAGRAHAQESPVDALRAAVRHRRGLVGDRKVAQQRLHDQLNTLCPGLSAPAGHGRSLAIEGSTGQAVLACAVALAGRAPTVRSLPARAPGRLTQLGPIMTSAIGRNSIDVPGWATCAGQCAAFQAMVCNVGCLTDVAPDSGKVGRA